MEVNTLTQASLTRISSLGVSKEAIEDFDNVLEKAQFELHHKGAKEIR